jgi:hypothetical protein
MGSCMLPRLVPGHLACIVERFQELQHAVLAGPSAQLNVEEQNGACAIAEATLMRATSALPLQRDVLYLLPGQGAYFAVLKVQKLSSLSCTGFCA